MNRLVEWSLAAFVVIGLGAGSPMAGAALAAGADPPVEKKDDKKVEDKKDEKVEEKKTEIKTKKKQKSSEWLDGYRSAVMMVRAERYDEAIIAFAKLEDAEDSPDVQNYIGFAHRKIGRMTAAKHYYEAALVLDPTHRGALEYYGEWHADVGDFQKARWFLDKIEAHHGRTAAEYSELAAVIERASAATVDCH